MTLYLPLGSSFAVYLAGFTNSIRQDGLPRRYPQHPKMNKNHKKNVFLSFPKSEKDVYAKLDFFNWSKPWNAGAQFANVCMLTNTQLSSQDSLNNSKYLNSYIKTKLNSKDGLYYSGKTSDKRELVYLSISELKSDGQ